MEPKVSKILRAVQIVPHGEPLRDCYDPMAVAVPISSPFVSVHANDPTPLWDGRIHLAAGGARTRGDGSLALAWQPEPAITWRQISGDLIPPVLNADRGRLVPWGLRSDAHYERLALKLQSARPIISHGLLPGGIEVGRRMPLASLVFHVANFPFYVGERLTSNGTTWAGRAGFEWREWIVELDQSPEEPRLRDELRSSYGYALTHVGRLRRRNEATYSVGSGLRCIEALHYLLGFVRGGWCGPALLSGRDGADRVVWQQWSVKLVSSANPRPSVFVASDPELLRRLAPGFIARASGRAWGESYRRAVALYVAANRGVPIEIGITLAQSALELLAWSTFVRSGRVAPGDFEAWPAARQIRELLARARIPTALPPSLVALSGLAGTPITADGPERMAYVRNRIVHPPRNRRLRKLSSPELIDTWRLMLNYAELVLLELARYSGEIHSRIDDRPVPVPWP
jgi:hypothetical protein